MKRALFIMPLFALLLLAAPAVPAAESGKPDAELPKEKPAETVNVVQHDDGSLEITITTTKDGKTETQTITAASETELMNKHPEIWGKYMDWKIGQVEEQINKIKEETEKRRIDFQKTLPEELKEQMDFLEASADFNTGLFKAVKQKQDFLYTLKYGGAEYHVSAMNSYSLEKLGIMFENIPPALAAQLSIEGSGGVVVSDITAGGLADKAGLKKYDVLTAIGDKDVASVLKLADALKSIDKEQEFVLKVIRKAQKQEVKMTIPPLPKEEPKEPIKNEAGAGNK